jgi:two-component system, cell cycle response regulator DivK
VAARSSKRGESKTRRRRILIVDDVADSRVLYEDYFSYRGFEVLLAATGAEAIESALSHRPDVIVMDLSMPTVDGWEATRRLKADRKTRATPIIVLTAHALNGSEESARNAGCNAFLTKPCSPEDLEQAVLEFLAES